MFRLFFVLALAFLLSSFVTSQNKSANQVIKVITCFALTREFLKTPKIYSCVIQTCRCLFCYMKKYFYQSTGTAAKPNCCVPQTGYCKDGE